MNTAWWKGAGRAATIASLMHYILLSVAIVIPFSFQHTYYVSTTGNGFIDSLLQWDAKWYQLIGKYGYDLPNIAQNSLYRMGNRGIVAPEQTIAFFPFLAQVTRVLTPLGALLLTNFLFVASLFMFSHWLHKRGRSATMGTLLMALAPAGVFFSSIYPETWILFCVLAVLLCSKKDSGTWVLACIAGYVSSSVSGLGILIGAFTLAFWMNREWFRGIAFALSVAMGWVMVAYNATKQGFPPLYFMHAEGKWERVWSAPFFPWFKEFTNPLQAGHLDQVIVALLTLLTVAALITAWKNRELRSIHNLWAVIYFLLSAATYWIPFPVVGQIRYMSVVYPMYDVFSVGKTNVMLKLGLLLIFALFYFYESVMFTHGLVAQ